MNSNELEIRNKIIEAGHILLEKKLIARTWGNISARLNESEFIITPSGKPYDALTTNDLVKVNMNDLSYEGNIKPSSEKGMHANLYLLKDKMNFIVHTHQNYATAISLVDFDLNFVNIAKYGLPSTKALAENVVIAMDDSINNTVLMKNHGVVSMGETMEEAFNNCEMLESKARALFDEIKVDNKKKNKPYVDDYAQMYAFSKKPVDKNDTEALELLKFKNDLASQIPNVKPMKYFDVMIQHLVYKMKYSKLKDK